ncbi:MAG: leucine-rich repeat domain-containing protein, partial [Promethearchaeota archaeon]
IFYNDKEINKSQYEKLLISIINKSSLQIIIHYKFEFGNFLNFFNYYGLFKPIIHLIRVIKKKAKNLNEKDGKKEKYLIDNITPILSNISNRTDLFDCTDLFDYTDTQDEKELIYAILEKEPPMELFLKNFKFLMLSESIRPGILFKYLQKFKRDYIVGIKKRNANIIKNLISLLDFVYKLYYKYYTNELEEYGRKIVSAILDIDPPEELFMHNLQFVRLIEFFKPNYTFENILVKKEGEVMKWFEKEMGGVRIPAVEWTKFDTFGFIYFQKHVVSIVLPRKGLTALPESIGNLTSLRNLDLEGNELTALPESIGNLTSLKDLDLGGNKLTALPESIGNLTSLRDLDLGGNKLTALPESIGNLTSLRNLDLEGNELTALDRIKSRNPDLHKFLELFSDRNK